MKSWLSRVDLEPDDIVAVFGFASFGMSLIKVLKPAAIVIALVAGVVWATLRVRQRQRRKLQRQEQMAAAARLQRVLNGLKTTRDPRQLLRDAADSLTLPWGWRISVYVLDGAFAWRRVVRLSDIAMYDAPDTGRPNIPEAEGLLGTAGRRGGSIGLRGAAEETGPFPDRNTQREAWLAAQLEWGVPADVAAALRMPVGKYAAVVVRLPGVGDEPDRTYAAVVEVLLASDSLRQRVEQYFDRAFFVGIDKLLALEPLVAEVSALSSAADQEAAPAR